MYKKPVSLYIYNERYNNNNEEIIKTLKTEKEVSIRRLMIKIRANRSTIKRGLDFLKKLEYVKEVRDILRNFAEKTKNAV